MVAMEVVEIMASELERPEIVKKEKPLIKSLSDHVCLLILLPSARNQESVLQSRPPRDGGDYSTYLLSSFN